MGQRGLSALLDAFSALSVLVVGEAIVDGYAHGRADRLCREAPVPVVAVERLDEAPGGAANAAVNARALGADVTLLSVIGDDTDGARLAAGLEARGVRADGVIRVPGRRTLTKRRIAAGGQVLLRVDAGDTGPLGAAAERALLERLEHEARRHDAVVVSDYGYGLAGAGFVRHLERLRATAGGVLVVDAKAPGRYRGARPTAVKPNYAEAARLLHLAQGGGERSGELARSGRSLLELTGAQMAVVTMDAEGAMLFEPGSAPYRTYARATSEARAIGAGDTFTAALALSLAAGADGPSAVELASAAAAVVCGRDGTAVCGGAELRERVAGGAGRVTTAPELVGRVAAERANGRRIVFTNGCFDILHGGHVSHLNAAKALGDVLVVAVNSDEGVRRLKGPGRPLNSLEDRLEVLAALSCIDHLVAFAGDTPEELLRALRPEVFVKGGDHRVETVPEARLVRELGGRVEILPSVQDRSTSALIERIRLAGPAAGRAPRDRSGAGVAAR